jgi:mRNA interferase ChpB
MSIKRGEIWLVGLDPAHGHEQKGRRPVLIVSLEGFNEMTKVPLVLPITSGGTLTRTVGFAVALAGTKTTGSVRCDQHRARSGGAQRPEETAPDAIIDEVLAKLTQIFE